VVGAVKLVALYAPTVHPAVVVGVMVNPSLLTEAAPWKTFEFTRVGTTKVVPAGQLRLENPTIPEVAPWPKAAGTEKRAVPRRVSARQVFMEEKNGFQ
jgi:hypothetical protein